MDNLKKALEHAMQKDIGRYADAEHEFSAEFESEMIKLSKNVSENPGKIKKRPRLRFVKVIVAAAAAVALFAAGTLAGAVSSGFDVARTTRLGLPSKLFTAVDTEDCPKTVETVYMLDGFPMNQISIFTNDERTWTGAMYLPAPFEPDKNGDMYAPTNDELYMAKIMHLRQYTKDTFEFEYTDMDYVTYKQLTVNGGQAYFITRERFYGMEAFLLWESEDYIFVLSGAFSEERALELANSLVVYDGEIPFSGFREV